MARPIEPMNDPSRQRSLSQFRDELNTKLTTGQPLTPEQQDQMLTNFLIQIEREIDARVDARLSETVRGRKGRAAVRTGTIAASLGLAIPLIAIAGGITGLIGIILVLAVVVFINLADALKA